MTIDPDQLILAPVELPWSRSPGSHLLADGTFQDFNRFKDYHLTFAKRHLSPVNPSAAKTLKLLDRVRPVLNSKPVAALVSQPCTRHPDAFVEPVEGTNKLHVTSRGLGVVREAGDLFGHIRAISFPIPKKVVDGIAT